MNTLVTSFLSTGDMNVLEREYLQQLLDGGSGQLFRGGER